MKEQFIGPKNIGNRHSAIMNISSTPALEGNIEGSSYTIAKSAILGLTKRIAKEYGENYIRCYILALGNISTIVTFDTMNDYERQKGF
ncbi:MAG TPA: SDR family NAD(P)-dependent oxidoreductase [Nitrososphaeraceae archaeon]|jgi:3-oxoacyl-[acyl-carrier protein] reductase